MSDEIARRNTDTWVVRADPAGGDPDHLEPVTRLENIMRGHHPWVLRDPEALKKAHDARWGRSA